MPNSSSQYDGLMDKASRTPDSLIATVHEKGKGMPAGDHAGRASSWEPEQPDVHMKEPYKMPGINNGSGQCPVSHVHP